MYFSTFVYFSDNRDDERPPSRETMIVRKSSREPQAFARARYVYFDCLVFADSYSLFFHVKIVLLKQLTYFIDWFDLIYDGCLNARDLT